MPIHDPRKMQWPQGMPDSIANTLMLEQFKDGWSLNLAEKTVSVRRNADHTLTVSADNYKESISISDKTEEELFEAIKYAIICANFEWSDQMNRYVRSEVEKIVAK